MTSSIESIPVVIIGAGPVGLALALDLAWQGKRSVILEQDAGTALVLLAKAGGLNERTLEFCRRWGIKDRVAYWGQPLDNPRDTCYCVSLAGHFIGRDPLPSMDGRPQRSTTPEKLRKCPQYVFDPILAEEVQKTGLAEIRYNSRVEKFEQDEGGVTISYTDGSGKPVTIRAQYMVGCDGATSQVRNALGIPFEGQTLDYSLSIALRIKDLHKYHSMGRVERFLLIGSEGTWANLTFMDYKDLWRLTVLGSEERQNMAARDVDAEVRRAFGRDDIPYEVVRAVPWRRSQCTARNYYSGRVVLAGDAAHTTSPTGGHGLNTGMGDVFGLGWVLSALLDGWGGSHLLEAYERERRPVTIRNSTQSTQNYKNWVNGTPDYSQVELDGTEGDAARERVGKFLLRALHPEWHSFGLAMGYRYDDSPIVVPDLAPAPPDHTSYYVPTARPGHRAPHVWLPDGRSTLDLFGRGFVLIRTDAGYPIVDSSALVAAAASRRMPLQVVELPQVEVAAAYEANLTLVRPDGHVAWRGNELPRDVEGLVDIVRGATVRQAES